MEFRSVDDLPYLNEYLPYIKSVAPNLGLVAIRSVGSDIYGVPFKGVNYLVWDEHYAELLLRIAAGLRVDPIVLQWFDPSLLNVCRQAIADTLFDEGSYRDAWILSQMTPKNRHVGIERYLEHPESRDSESQLDPVKLSAVFLLLHELGHLCERDNPEFYRALETEALDALFMYRALLARLSPSERDRFLADEHLVCPEQRDVEAGKLLDRNDADPKLSREWTPDLFALFLLCQLLKMLRPNGLTIDEARCVVESVISVRFAAEIVRDLRMRTHAFAYDLPSPEVISEAERFRTILIRQCLTLSLEQFFPPYPESIEAQGGAVWLELNEPYFRLLGRRRKIFSETSEGVGMTMWNVLLGHLAEVREKLDEVKYLDCDLDDTYRRGFLRDRGWAQAAPDEVEQELEVLIKRVRNSALSD